ncbi:2-hydroxyacyl-CoA dehydratase [Calorimonas adulescens]|uniref:2-hydroxyacyl-CoA dehydratase n=2 Tax=Calorimonas adulescens TaxID=2606906 RepID=A0A5D8QDG7_9THEO|nr:2-hydroxyacyl-CoA dehydratase [Calorimonas adulescens]
MNIVDIYMRWIKKSVNDPEKVRKLVVWGLMAEHVFFSLFGDKHVPKSFNYLNKIGVEFVLSPLVHSDQSAWVNLFAPTEILHAMDIYPLCIEAFSSFLVGFQCEDVYIDYAQRFGISDTLCSYHKGFIGAALTDLLPKPKFMITSSMLCDANISTFRYLSWYHHVPMYSIDVPFEYSSQSVSYLEGQLREMVKMLEQVTGKKMDEDKLKEVIKRENKTHAYMNRYIDVLRYKCHPTTLTLEMYMLFVTHTFMGTQQTLRFFEILMDEMESFPDSKAKRVFWVHIVPFYPHGLKRYFNYSRHYEVLGLDLNFDYLEEMDCDNPYRALAIKMILNHGNGPYQRKIGSIMNIIDRLQPDGVIHFCQWGCKQSVGGMMLLKQMLDERGIPFLALDGDGADRRNHYEGQVNTRLEAFLEMIGKRERCL